MNFIELFTGDEAQRPNLQQQIQIFAIGFSALMTAVLGTNPKLKAPMVMLLKTLDTPDPVVHDGIQALIATVEAGKK